MANESVQDLLIQMHGEIFATVTILSTLLLRMHEGSSQGAKLASETLDQAAEIARNASMALSTEHTTYALDLITKLQKQIVDPATPRADPAAE